MADENTTSTEAPATEVKQDAPKPVKRRTRAAKKPAAVKTEVAAKVKPEAPKMKKRTPAERARLLAQITKAIKGGKTTLKSALTEAGVSEQTYYNWKNEAAKVQAKPAAAQSDDLKDLVALETENKRLRKQLADKLRTENAQLRKRLGLS